MNPFTFKHKMTAQDYGNFFIYVVFNKRLFNKILFYFITPVIGIVFLITSIVNNINSPGLYIWIAFLILMTPMFRLFYRFMGKKAFNKTPLLGLENEYQFSDEMILGINERGEQKFFFTDIMKASETKHYLFIQLGGQLFIWLSKEQIGESSTEKVKAFLANKVPDKCKFLINKNQ